MLHANVCAVGLPGVSGVVEFNGLGDVLVGVVVTVIRPTG